MSELELEQAKPLTKKKQLEVEKDEKHAYISKLLRSGAIMDLFLANRRGDMTPTWTHVTYKAYFPQRVRYHGSAELKVFYKAPGRYTPTLMDMQKTFSAGVLSRVRSHLTGKYPKDRALKKVPVEILELNLEHYPTEDDIAWAEVTLKNCGIDLTDYHLNEKRFKVTFEIATTATQEIAFYAKNLEEAQAKAQEIANLKVGPRGYDSSKLNTNHMQMVDSAGKIPTIKKIEDVRMF